MFLTKLTALITGGIFEIRPRETLYQYDGEKLLIDQCEQFTMRNYGNTVASWGMVKLYPGDEYVAPSLGLFRRYNFERKLKFALPEDGLPNGEEPRNELVVEEWVRGQLIQSASLENCLQSEC